jgi:hypothetical protein
MSSLLAAALRVEIQPDNVTPRRNRHLPDLSTNR